MSAPVFERVALIGLGLIVRRVEGYGLPGHLRVSIGDEEGCRAVACALRDFGAGS